jgi:hypothetical protein
MFDGDSVSVVSGLLERLVGVPPLETIEQGRLLSAMQTRYREFGPFEAQLFALERLRADGEVALALIGTLSLLEWVLNSFIGNGGGKERNLASSIRDERITFFSDPQKDLIDTARRARNAAVHGEPPSRNSLVAGGSAAGREVEGLSTKISSLEVRQIIELVFMAYRETNLAARK